MAVCNPSPDSYDVHIFNSLFRKVLFLSTITAFGYVAYYRHRDPEDNEAVNTDLRDGEAPDPLSNIAPSPPAYNEPPLYLPPPEYFASTGSQSQV